MSIKRRVSALERKSTGAKEDGWCLTIYAWPNDPLCAYINGPNGVQQVSREEGESAEAFEHRCRQLAGE